MFLNVKIYFYYFDRVNTLQHENLTLRQQLDESRLKGSTEGKEDGDKFTLMLSTLRDDHSKVSTTCGGFITSDIFVNISLMVGLEVASLLRHNFAVGCINICLFVF